jgi:hypothetical protein
VPQSAQREGTRETVPLPVFEFHSGFWVNLHHTLYFQARQRQQRPTTRPARKAAEASAPSGLTPEEKSAWEETLSFYEHSMAARDLLFDGDMVLIKNRLAEVENCTDLSGGKEPRCASGLRPELISALERAAPVYRAKWWPEHDKRNREWINGIAARVQQSGKAMGTQLAAVFHADWPSARIRVEVSNYAGLLGSYTSQDPVTVTISSEDERNQGTPGLEVLFYEASHSIGGIAREIITRECRARGRPIPRELWDAMLYYTAIMISRSGAPRGAAEPGTAVAERGWRGYRLVLDGYWKPFLQNALKNQGDPEDLERAITRMIAAL